MIRKLKIIKLNIVGHGKSDGIQVFPKTKNRGHHKPQFISLRQVQKIFVLV